MKSVVSVKKAHLLLQNSQKGKTNINSTWKTGRWFLKQIQVFPPHGARFYLWQFCPGLNSRFIYNTSPTRADCQTQLSFPPLSFPKSCDKFSLLWSGVYKSKVMVFKRENIIKLTQKISKLWRISSCLHKLVLLQFNMIASKNNDHQQHCTLLTRKNRGL